MTDLNYEITIQATPETIYAHLTERDGLLRWIGIEATSNPVPGGDLTWTHENGATMIGRFIELEPPHRVVFSYGWQDNLMGLPPEATIVDVRLVPQAEGTRVELTHRDLPPDSFREHHHGWDHFLGQLCDLLLSASRPMPAPSTRRPLGNHRP